MPFEQKKQQQRVGPPTHAQEVAVQAIDGAFGDLVRVLTFVSKNHLDMRQIIQSMNGPVIAAKQWVLAN